MALNDNPVNFIEAHFESVAYYNDLLTTPEGDLLVIDPIVAQNALARLKMLAQSFQQLFEGARLFGRVDRNIARNYILRIRMHQLATSVLIAEYQKHIG